MYWELAVNSRDEVILATDERLPPGGITRLVWLRGLRIVRVDFAFGGDETLTQEPDPAIAAALNRADEAMVLVMDGDRPIEGWLVPVDQEPG